MSTASEAQYINAENAYKIMHAKKQIRKTMHKSQKMHENEKRSSLYGNINFESLPPKWTGFQPHQEHSVSTLKMHTKHWAQIIGIRKLEHGYSKLHK